MHCLVFTDTDLYGFTKGKSYLAKQKWRRPTCLRDQCYDVGCHPCIHRTNKYAECFFYISMTCIFKLIWWKSDYHHQDTTKLTCIFVQRVQTVSEQFIVNLSIY